MKTTNRTTKIETIIEAPDFRDRVRALRELGTFGIGILGVCWCDAFLRDGDPDAARRVAQILATR
jgi:hypothetical protein